MVEYVALVQLVLLCHRLMKPVMMYRSNGYGSRDGAQARVAVIGHGRLAGAVYLNVAQGARIWQVSGRLPQEHTDVNHCNFYSPAHSGVGARRLHG